MPMILQLAAGLYLLVVARFVVGLLRAFRARSRLTLGPLDQLPADLPPVTVVVPARDEEAGIEACLESILAQEYPRDRLRVVLVDDHSRDRTRELAGALAARHPVLEIREAPDLPPGWTGKNHACRTGSEGARGEWICFLDADTRAAPRLLATTIHHARSRALDLLSMNPFQALESPGERAVLPAVFLVVATTMDFLRIADPDSPVAIANGQFMLFRRSTYEALGGHEAVAPVVHEDLAFARAVKDSGHQLGWIFGDALLTTRMYADLPQIWRGFSKNMGAILGLEGGSAVLGASLRCLVLAWLGPLLLLLGRGDPLVCFLAWAGLGTLAGVVLGSLRELRVPLGYVLLAPLGFTFQALLVLESHRREVSGRKVWKGREYP